MGMNCDPWGVHGWSDSGVHITLIVLGTPTDCTMCTVCTWLRPVVHGNFLIWESDWVHIRWSRNETEPKTRYYMEWAGMNHTRCSLQAKDGFVCNTALLLPVIIYQSVRVQGIADCKLIFDSNVIINKKVYCFRNLWVIDQVRIYT